MGRKYFPSTLLCSVLGGLQIKLTKDRLAGGKNTILIQVPLGIHRKISLKEVLEFEAYIPSYWASLVAQMIKNLPAMQDTRVQFLGWEDPPEKGMALHSSILAWRIPWTEEPGRLQSMGSQKVDTTE